MAVGTQIGVLAPTRMPANARTIGFDKQLQAKELLEDIYSNLVGLYNTEKKTVPNGIEMRVSDSISETSEGRITVKLPLNGSGVYGNNFAIGTEERPRTRTASIYRNDFRKTVDAPNYGVRKLDAKLYKLYERHIDDLGPFAKEHYGLEIRQTMVERYGETLVWGDTQATCVRHWNMNIFVCGLPLSTCSPTYSATLATYTTNIVNTLALSGGGSIKIPHTGQTLTNPNLANLSNFCLRRSITPLNIPGLPSGKGYVLTFSELQAVYIGSPEWCERNLGTSYIRTTRLPERVQNWRGVLGAFNNLLLVMDPRQPTIDITGTSAPHGLSAQYVWPGGGEEDERNRDQDTVCDTFFVHGKGSYINWYPEKIHHIQQLDDYGKIQGHGLALVRGVQLPHYTDENGNNPEQFSSILGLARIPEYNG